MDEIEKQRPPENGDIGPYFSDASWIRRAAIGLAFGAARKILEGAAVAAHGAGSLARRVLLPLGSVSLVRDFIDGVVGQVVRGLSDSPQVTELIKAQINQLVRDDDAITRLDDLVTKLASHYIAHLEEYPEQLAGLVRKAGDNYIAYLQENPEHVQTLVQGQSRTLTAQIRDEMRERTVTGDSSLERLARSFLRRRPRAELPGPPLQAADKAR